MPTTLRLNMARITKKMDKEIAKAVVNALTWNSSVPDDKLIIEVRNGWVTLSGELEWDFQKESSP